MNKYVDFGVKFRKLLEKKYSQIRKELKKYAEPEYDELDRLCIFNVDDGMWLEHVAGYKFAKVTNRYGDFVGIIEDDGFGNVEFTKYDEVIKDCTDDELNNIGKLLFLCNSYVRDCAINNFIEYMNSDCVIDYSAAAICADGDVRLYDDDGFVVGVLIGRIRGGYIFSKEESCEMLDEKVIKTSILIECCKKKVYVC